MTDEFKRCPVCLGTGKVTTPDVEAHARHHLLPEKTVVCTCPICHGKGERPGWMNELPSVSHGHTTG